MKHILDQTGSGRAEPALKVPPQEISVINRTKGIIIHFNQVSRLVQKLALILSLIIGFNSFANLPQEGSRVGNDSKEDSRIDFLDKLGVNQDHTPIKESDQKKIKAYIIGLLAQVFSHEIDIFPPSLKAKKELDQIVNYINKNDNETSRFLIEVFVDSLFYTADSEKEISSKQKLKRNRDIAGFEVRTNSVVFISDMIQNPVAESLLLRRLYHALGVSDPRISSFKKRTITPEVQMALYALADIRPSIGQKDFDLQKAIFDIMKKAYQKKDYHSREGIVFEVATRSLFHLNPSYPSFDLFLAKVVRGAVSKRMMDHSVWPEVALETLEKMSQVNIKVYRLLRKLYHRKRGTTIGGAHIDLLKRVVDNMERVFEPENFTTKPVSNISDNSVDRVEIEESKDKNLFRVPLSVVEYVENLKVNLDTRTVRQHLKNLIRKAPSSQQFLETLFFGLDRSANMYDRSLAMDIIENMSINESEIEAFFKDPKNDPKHKELVMRLWVLIDPKSPRRQNMLESNIFISNFKDNDILRESAQRLLREGTINIEDLHFDKQGRPIVTCQHSFGGRKL